MFDSWFEFITFTVLLMWLLSGIGILFGYTFKEALLITTPTVFIGYMIVGAFGGGNDE